MKKIVLFLVVVIIFVIVQWSRIKPDTQDGLSGSYLGVGEEFGFDLRIDNSKGEIVWFLDVKNSDIKVSPFLDKVKIDLILETGMVITIVDTDKETSQHFQSNHAILKQTVNSMPVEVKISYNEIEEEIKLMGIAVKYEIK